MAATLLAWLKLIALDGALAKAEPKTLRYRLLHAAARLVRGGRRRLLKIAATWPWAQAIVTAWERASARWRTRPDSSGACPAPATKLPARTVEPPDTRPGSRSTVMPAAYNQDQLRSRRGRCAPAPRPVNDRG